MKMLDGLRTLVVGVSNKNSLGWAIASAWRAAGGQVAISYEHERFKAKLTALCGEDRGYHLVGPCDVTDENQVKTLLTKVTDVYEGHKLDALMHSVAYAPKEALHNAFRRTTPQDFATTQAASVYSLIALANAAQPLMSAGGSIITLSFIGSQKVCMYGCSVHIHSLQTE